MKKLIFIDTNILLDFYRFLNSDIRIKYLEVIDNHHNKIITSAQVQMEFKKHRGEEIKKSYEAISTPNWHSLTAPAILTESEPAKILKRKRGEIETQLKTLQKRVLKLLDNPAANDKVYQTTQRLFKNLTTEINLHKAHASRDTIRRLASKRFMLGYPPRKKDDTSIGDCINWEWVIDCAKRKDSDVIIVTRDTDYGQYFKDKAYINDWLDVEFKERVGKRRKITLTNKLSFAFKEAISKQTVTKQMETAEQEMILDSEIASKNREEIPPQSVRQFTTDEQIQKLKRILGNLK